MLKLEYKRYLFSKSTLIFLLVIILISAISWGTSLHEQTHTLAQNARFETAPAGEWLHIDYDGWTFLYNLWFNNGGSTALTIYFIYAWMGVVLSSRLHAEKNSRFGNLVITRQGYRKRLHHVLSVQSLYIVTLISAYILISFIGSLVLGGGFLNASTVGIATYGWLAWLGIALLQFLWLSFAFVVINIFCLLLNMWIKQKQLLQILPFFLFFIVPLLLWSLTVHSAPALFRIVSGFHTENTMYVFGFLFQDWGFNHFLRGAQTVFTTTILVAILYPLHISKGAKDYL